MKLYIILLFIINVNFISCKKDSPSATVTFNNKTMSFAREGKDSTEKVPVLKDYVVVPNGADSYVDVMDHDGTLHHSPGNNSISRPILNPNNLGGLPTHFPGPYSITGFTSIDWDINKIVVSIRNSGKFYIAVASYDIITQSYTVTSVKQLNYSTSFDWAIHHIECDADPYTTKVFAIVSCVPFGQSSLNNALPGAVVDIDYFSGAIGSIIDLPFSGDFQGLDLAYYLSGSTFPGKIRLFRYNDNYHIGATNYHGTLYDFDMGTGSYTKTSLFFPGSYLYQNSLISLFRGFYSDSFTNPFGTILYPSGTVDPSDYTFPFSSGPLTKNTNSSNLLYNYDGIIVPDATVAY